jgi:hypothetical protein
MTPPGKFGDASELVRTFVRRFTKGALLVLWIGVLFILALLAWSRGVAGLIASIEVMVDQDTNGVRETEDRGIYPGSPLQHLQDYLSDVGADSFDNPPPIGTVLDSLINAPSWMEWDHYFGKLPEIASSVSIESRSSLSNEQDTQLIQEYEEVFLRVHSRLVSVASTPGLDPNTIQIRRDIVPPIFRAKEVELEDLVPLPVEAVAWVKASQDQIGDYKAREELVETFLYLIVLGALGSLIFLTRDYIAGAAEATTTISAFVFRPFLGMFLAMAMFVISILVHSVVSNSDVADLRPEPLYLLAFAAGLVSEQAYQVVNLYAQDALEAYKKKLSDRKLADK